MGEKWGAVEGRDEVRWELEKKKRGQRETGGGKLGR